MSLVRENVSIESLRSLTAEWSAGAAMITGPRGGRRHGFDFGLFLAGQFAGAWREVLIHGGGAQKLTEFLPELPVSLQATAQHGELARNGIGSDGESE